MSELPDYVRTLPSGTEPTDDADILDASAMDDVERQIREMEQSRAAAEVSGRDYLIFGNGRDR